MLPIKYTVICLALVLTLPLLAEEVSPAANTSEGQWQGSTACNYPIPQDTVIYQYTQALSQQAPLISKTIQGIAFTKESKILLNLFERLTRHATAEDFKLARLQNCDKVMCALEAMLAERTAQYELSLKDLAGKDMKQATSKQVGGKLMAHTMVYILNNYNANLSHLSDPRKEAVLMSTDEVNDILMGLRFFPKKTFPLYGKELFISHYQRGKVRANSTAEGRFYGAGELAGETRDHIEFRRDTGSPTHLLHELGHYIDSSSIGREPFGTPGFSYSNVWKGYSGGWNGSKPGDYNAFARWGDESASEIYGTVGPNEDFAEAVAFYRIEPLKLWQASPGKYNFIKKYVYQNVEFLNNQQCSKAVDVPAHVSADYQAELPASSPSSSASEALDSSTHSGVKNDCKVIKPGMPHYFNGSCDPKFPYFVTNRTATDWAGTSCYATYGTALAKMLKQIPQCQNQVDEQELQAQVERLEQMVITGSQDTCEVKEHEYCPENYKWTLFQAGTATGKCYRSRNQAIGQMFKLCP